MAILLKTPINPHSLIPSSPPVMSLDNLYNPPPPPLGATCYLMDLVVNGRRPRRSNGTIALTRRQSSTPHGQSTQSDSTTQLLSAEIEDAQPPANLSYDSPTATRYSKEVLLDVCKALSDSEATSDDVSRLFSENWNPSQANGTHRGWGKTHEGRDNHGPYACWEAGGSVQPISFEEMTEVERNVSSLKCSCCQVC